MAHLEIAQALVMMMGTLGIVMLGLGVMVQSRGLKRFSAKVIVFVLVILFALEFAIKSGVVIPVWVAIGAGVVAGLMFLQFLLNQIFGRDVGTHVIGELIVHILNGLWSLIAGPVALIRRFMKF